MLEESNTVAQTLDANDGSTEQTTDAGTKVTEQAEGTVSWDSDDNPYKKQTSQLTRQMQGFQGILKQLQGERQKLLETQNLLAEELAATKARYDGQTDTEVESVRQNVREQTKVQLQIENIRQKEQDLAAKEAEMQIMAKPMILADIAKRYGIDAADLEECESSVEAERLAKTLTKYTRQTKLESRRETKVDVVESSGSGGLNLSKLSTREKLLRGVAQEIRKT